MENIALREVDKNDWDFVLELRNSSYEFFYKQKKPLEKTEHYQYMEKQSGNPNFHQWIITLDQNDVGYVRILENDIGIMIQKNYQNKGIATKALSLAEIKAKELGLTKLIALVNKDNESSKKIFENNDYVLSMFWLEKEIS